MKTSLNLVIAFFGWAMMVASSQAGTVDYTYDAAGRLIGADYGGGKSIAWCYDANGNLTQRVTRTSYEGPYLITTIAGPGGYISPTNPWIAHGSTQLFVIAAQAWFDVGNVMSNGTSVGAVTNYLWQNVTAPGTLEAIFTARAVTNSPVPVPQWWLAEYGITTNFEAATTNDADGDGIPTWAEYPADTSPINSNSALRCGFAADGQLWWVGGTGVIQYLEQSDNLFSNDWKIVATNGPPTPVTNAASIPTGDPQGYYRIRAVR
jgi:YD repeat-containing protein